MTEKSDPLVEHYLSASRADNTRRAYESDLRAFQSFGGTTPIDAAAVARYIAHRAGRLKPSTLRRQIAAIASFHRDLGVEDPTKAPIVARVMRGVERSHGMRPSQVSPLTIGDLAAIVQRMGNARNHLRDRAMILVGFFGALRRSEIAHLERETLRFENDAATLFVRRSKTDQLAMGRTIGLSRRSDAICPVRALGEYLEVHPQATGPLFLGSTPDGWVNERTIARVVKRWVEAIGGNPQQYSGHSLRAGFATAAALSGLSMPLIAVQTGHRTVQALSSYVRVSAFPGLPDAAG